MMKELLMVHHSPTHARLLLTMKARIYGPKAVCPANFCYHRRLLSMMHGHNGTSDLEYS